MCSALSGVSCSVALARARQHATHLSPVEEAAGFGLGFGVAPDAEVAARAAPFARSGTDTSWRGHGGGVGQGRDNVWEHWLEVEGSGWTEEEG